MRSRINATQPPNNPPPMIVVSSSTSFSSHTDPCACITSLMPPCTRMTANAIVAPTTNHQKNTFTDATESSHVGVAVKGTVLNGFRNVHDLNLIRVGQIGDGARDP